MSSADVPIRGGDVLLIEWERGKPACRWAVLEVVSCVASLVSSGLVYELLILDEDGLVKKQLVGLDELTTPWYYLSRRVTRLR